MSEQLQKPAGASSSRTRKLQELSSLALSGGGSEKAKAQKGKGKLLARERLEELLDEGSFQEIGLLVEPALRHPSYQGRLLGADGVVTGVGKILGRSVAVFSQDFTVLGGSLGLAHARKICRILDLARESGMPVLGLCDSGGARIQEGVESLGGYADIFYRNVQASGAIPQISAILGPCAGGAVYSPALTDFVFMVEKVSHMFITGPEVLRAATGEQSDFESLGGAQVHGEKSGVCHFVCASESQCFRQIQELLSYLPSSFRERPPYLATSDPADRESPFLEELSEGDSKRAYSVKDAIWEIVDDRKFFEVHRSFAPNLVVGFARMHGEVVGVVANDPAHLAGALDIAASEKGARFIRFCDAFQIPLLTLVDVPGYWPGVDQEHGGIIRRGAKLLYAYCEATVPKVTVVLRKAYGGAYDVMASKHVHGDFNFAWPNAEIAVMGPQGAVEILYSKELARAEDPEGFRQKMRAEYLEHFTSPYQAARRGYLDEVILARHTRKKVIAALEVLQGKSVAAPGKRHANMPL
ncbi:MAG: acyl-CoA carboxylase subunit beta [Elusimicrobia bacterium]|nr:acyl-CoA carboxylase subunit beta [Elusimicrobiota bacterium]